MASDDLVAWLRAQVQARLELAREAFDLTAEEPWRFDRGGRPVPQIAGAPWESWCTAGTWDCEDPLCGCDELRRVGTVTGEHIAANDPRDTIARCEAELAILDKVADVAERHGEESVPGRIALHFAELLGSGHQHRPGYREGWKP